MASTYGRKRRRRKKRKVGPGWGIPRGAFPSLLYPFPGSYQTANFLQAPFTQAARSSAPVYRNGSSEATHGRTGSSLGNMSGFDPWNPLPREVTHPGESGGTYTPPSFPMTEPTVSHQDPYADKAFEHSTGDGQPPI